MDVEGQEKYFEFFGMNFQTHFFKKGKQRNSEKKCSPEFCMISVSHCFLKPLQPSSPSSNCQSRISEKKKTKLWFSVFFCSLTRHPLLCEVNGVTPKYIYIIVYLHFNPLLQGTRNILQLNFHDFFFHESPSPQIHSK